jgi:iron complex outermembrane receptor protein
MFFMKQLITKSTLLFLFILINSIAFSQSFTIKGSIKDAVTGEGLIGASVIAKPGVGGVTDIEGNYSFKIEPGTYTLKVNYVGYLPMEAKVKVIDKDVTSIFVLESQTLDEVEITANIGTVRETPVAITNISQQKIQEELAGRDLPMILNSTPGVYATEQGGGAGDSRITLRGFDQTNIAVMVDGVPVNDMENGAVYWSNWDGLSEITKTMQVQRGLGATKLAVSSAGGTMNIITKSIEQKPEISVKQDFGNNNYKRTAFSYNSGLKNDKFGIVLAGSYRSGDGYVQGTFLEAWSYFVKLQWRVNSRHMLSLSGNGAPQRHGQRAFQTTLGVFNKGLASELGVEDPNKNMNLSGFLNANSEEKPRSYNYDVAVLNGEDYYLRTNYYHKPLFNLSHFWSVNDKLTVSTVGYASFGFGGGVSINNIIPNDKSTGYIDINNLYNSNSSFVASGNTLKYYGSERSSSNFLRASVNNHRWYGLLSTATYKINKPLTLTLGVDARYYQGLHYREVKDLLGGDYIRDLSDRNAAKGVIDPFNPTAIDQNFKNEMKRVGDKITYNYDGLVNWGGLFGQLEYKKDKWTAFMTLTGSYTGYQRKDYFERKDVTIGEVSKGLDKFIDYFKDNRNDDVFTAAVGFNETLLANSSSNQTQGNSFLVYTNHNHRTFESGDTTFVVKYVYNSSTLTTNPVDTFYLLNAKKYTIDSKEANYSTSRKKWFPGYTVKGGVNYKLNSHYNVYANIGALSVAPKFNNVFNGNQIGNKEFEDSKNQFINSQEVGLGINYKPIAVNVNVYYTKWDNKPVPTVTGTNNDVYNINGINTSHFGVEVDWVYKIIKQIEWESAVSVADWKYKGGSKVVLTDDVTGNIVGTVDYSANNVHLGNAAQLQISNALRFTIYKRFWIKPRFTYFGKNYSEIRATDLVGANKDKESWKMPNYGLFDLAAGYEYKLDKIRINLNVNVTNLLDAFYISDATNNAVAQNFDANSATVFIGPGRQFKFGVKLTF